MKMRFLIVLCLFISACGGGGDGGSSPTPVTSSTPPPTAPPPPAQTNLQSAPAQSAFLAYWGSPQNTVLTDASGDTVQLVSNPTGPITGTGQVYAPYCNCNLAYNFYTNVIETFTINGEVSIGNAMEYFLGSRIVYVTYPSGQYVTTVGTDIPPTLSVGDNGTWTTLTLFNGNNSEDATITETYAVDAYNPSALEICVDSVESVTEQGIADGVGAKTIGVCYTDDANGNLTLLSLILTVSGETFVFK
jgi:hypothetical protein